MKRRTAVSRTIDDVHAEPRLKQIRDPARTSVWRAHPIGALAAAAVDEHHRVRMPHPRRNPVLDVHLSAADDGAARETSLLDADPEIAPLGEIERAIGWRVALRERRRGVGGACDGTKESGC